MRFLSAISSRGASRRRPHSRWKLFAWSRYAEISADRAGALCSRELEAEAHALFRLSSGLVGSTIDFRLEDFLAQIDEMQSEDDQPGGAAPADDWFSTHPFSPLRVKALQLLSESELVAPGGKQVAELDNALQTLMALMEPSYLEERSDEAEAMRRVLFAGAIAVADASDGISEAEIEAFEQFFGKGSFSERLDIERIKGELDARIEEARERATHARHIQVVRDLCTVARASGRVEAAEQAVIAHIAEALEVPCWLVDQCFCAEVELD